MCGGERSPIGKITSAQQESNKFSFSTRPKQSRRHNPDESNNVNSSASTINNSTEEKDIVDVIRTMCLEACQSDVQPSEFLDVIKMMKSNFALYQLNMGCAHFQQDTDYVPGIAIADFLKNYLIPAMPDMFPPKFPLDSFVAKLCWFAGQQRSIHQLQLGIHEILGDDFEESESDSEDDEDGQEEGEKDKEKEKEEKSNSSKSKSKSMSSDKETSVMDVKHSNELFVECLPIKRFLAALVLLSDAGPERKLRCLELLERADAWHPKPIEECNAGSECVYHKGGQDIEYHPPTRGKCNCIGAQTLQSMEDLLERTWSMAYRIQLALSAVDEEFTGVHVEEDTCWHHAMRRRTWKLSNGVEVTRGDLPMLVEKSSAYQRMKRMFQIVPHLYGEAEQKINTKAELRKQSMKLKAHLQLQSGNNIEKIRNQEKKQEERLESMLRVRSIDWSTTYGDDAIVQIQEEEEIENNRRSNECLSNWRPLLLQGLSTIRREAEDLSEIQTILRSSQSWLDQLTLFVEWSHLTLELATDILTSPLTANDAMMSGSSSSSSSSSVGSRERPTLSVISSNVVVTKRQRNPWVAIRQNDSTSLAWLLRNGSVNEMSVDPDTGMSIVETAALSGHSKMCWYMLDRVVQQPSTVTAVKGRDGGGGGGGGVGGGGGGNTNGDVDFHFVLSDTSDDVILHHPRLSECSLRSANMEIIRMCARYQRGQGLYEVFKYQSGLLSACCSTDQICETLFRAHRENWRTDMVRFVHKLPPHQVGWSPLPPSKPSIDSGKKQEEEEKEEEEKEEEESKQCFVSRVTSNERRAASVTNAMSLCCARDYTYDQGRRTALESIMRNNDVQLLSSIVFGIDSEERALQGRGLWSGMKSESIRRRSVEIYILCWLVDRKQQQREEREGGATTSSEASKKGNNTPAKSPTNRLSSGDFVPKRTMVESLGHEWAVALLGEKCSFLIKDTTFSSIFLRPNDHPVSFRLDQKTQERLMKEKVLEIEQWNQETVDIHTMAEYCKQLEKRCARVEHVKKERRTRMEKREKERKGKQSSSEILVEEEKEEKEKKTEEMNVRTKTAGSDKKEEAEITAAELTFELPGDDIPKETKTEQASGIELSDAEEDLNEEKIQLNMELEEQQLEMELWEKDWDKRFESWWEKPTIKKEEEESKQEVDQHEEKSMHTVSPYDDANEL